MALLMDIEVVTSHRARCIHLSRGRKGERRVAKLPPALPLQLRIALHNRMIGLLPLKKMTFHRVLLGRIRGQTGQWTAQLGS